MYYNDSHQMNIKMYKPHCNIIINSTPNKAFTLFDYKDDDDEDDNDDFDLSSSL